MAKGKGGCPPRYKTVDEMIIVIDKYFKECEGEVLRDGDGSAVLNKYGEPIVIKSKPPTVTGLAYALGFTSRQALLNYQAKKEFVDTVTRAKLKIEEYAEQRLFDRDGVHGAKFSLLNNFKGWSERPQTELDIEEQKSRIELNKAKLQLPMSDDKEDGFIEALKGSAVEDWDDHD